MEAHNGLSAKIVQEAGFEGIWASGLSISASLGVRDNNEASWTQVLEVAEFMADAATIPILLDGDTGYGNWNSMRRLVKKLEQRGIAGVCIEDKVFPKTNSFVRCATQPLADIDEFAGKIKAGKDAQSDDDFVLVARVEAFVAGWRARRSAPSRGGVSGCRGGRHSHSQRAAISRRDPRVQKGVERPRPRGHRANEIYRTPTEVFREHGFPR